MEKEYTLAVIVENKSGVLAHIAGLFSGRGFNISELSVGETEIPEYSRITIVVKSNDKILDQVKKQLNKFIDVVKVTDLSLVPSVHREIILIKVKSSRTEAAGDLSDSGCVQRKGGGSQSRFAHTRGHGNRGEDRGPYIDPAPLRHPRNGEDRQGLYQQRNRKKGRGL